MKDKEAFRDYNKEDEIGQRVKRTYTEMHTNQTVEFVRAKHEKWLKFNHFQATVMEALEMLNELVDESDPDTDLPNIVHAFQTAERIRAEHPDKEWLQLIGLIHDLGKVMAFYNEPQWCVVGKWMALKLFKFCVSKLVKVTPGLWVVSPPPQLSMSRKASRITLT